MTAVVLAFPYAHRHDGLPQRIARRAAEFRPHKAEEHIERQLNIQRDTMRRRGIDEARVQAEIKSLETLVRLAQASMPLDMENA